MRFLHTSDWHIGRQFHHVSLLEDQRQVLFQMIDIIREKHVDVVLVSGDIYDRSVPSSEAVQLLDEVIHQMNQGLKIPVIMIAGNHDGADRLAFGARQLSQSGVHIFGPLTETLKPVILTDAAGEVAFYALPYADPATVRNFLNIDVHSHDAAMQALCGRVRADNGTTRRCVLLSHCYLEGGDSSDSERPLAIGGADQVSAQHFRDFHYSALGHLHGAQFKTAHHIRYSGSILKYSFSEVNHHKSVTLVDMDEQGACTIEKIPLTPLRDLRVIEGLLNDVLIAGKTDPKSDDYLLVRLLDKHAILDVMGKLREVYPNVLSLERPALAVGGERKTIDKSRIQKGEMPMFFDFYEQMTGDALDDAEGALVSGLLDDIHRGAES